MEDNKTMEIIQELQLKKKSFVNCFSAEEVELIREWNKAIDECINIVKNYV